MTQVAINKQIEAIKSVTQEALKTKESARQFLVDAGIVKPKSSGAIEISVKPKK